MRYTMWRAMGIAGVVIVLTACQQAPLEVVVEEPDYRTGVTVRPVTGPAADPNSPRIVNQGPEPVRPTPVTPLQEPVGETQGFDVVEERDGGLVERLPNTCKLENYQQYQGQSAGVLASSGLDRAWRIIGPTTIVSQEYDPARLNFRTNGSGVIQRITCG